MKVLLVVPILKDESGHQYIQTLTWQEELERNGIETVIFGNIEASSECLKLKNFFPCLEDIISPIFALNILPSGIFKVIRLIRVLRKQLEENIFGREDFTLPEGGVLFLHSLFVFELLAFAWLASRRQEAIRASRFKIIIGLNYTYKRKNCLETGLFVFLYKYLFTFLTRGISSQITYISAEEETCRDYWQLMGKKVYLVPPPLYNRFLDSSLQITNNTDQNSKVRISYLGASRYNKGFDFIAQNIDVLLQDKYLRDQAEFTIQIDLQLNQHRFQKDIVFQAERILREYSRQYANLRLVFGILTTADYYRILAGSEIVLFPYRKEAFSCISSGIFKEAVMLGRVPVVSSGTRMASDLAGCGLSELVFSLGDTTGFFATVKKAAQNLRFYQEKMLPLRDSYREMHAAGNSLRQFLALVS